MCRGRNPCVWVYARCGKTQNVQPRREEHRLEVCVIDVEDAGQATSSSRFQISAFG